MFKKKDAKLATLIPTPEKESPCERSYKNRRLSRLKKRRRIRKVKIILARFRFFARIASLVGIIWAFLVFINLPCWYLDKNIFNKYPNKYLEIEGNKIVSIKQVMEKLHKVTLPQRPLYLINTIPIESRLREMTPVKKVFVRRYWLPARLKIVIDERTPVVSIAPTQKSAPIAVFTRDLGEIRVLGPKYLPLPTYLQTYRVITFDDFNKWKPSLIPFIEKLAIYLESAANDRLVYLDIRNPDDVYAMMRNVKLRIGSLNGKEVFNRIAKVSSVIPEAMKIKDNISYIDLRWNNVSIKLKKKDGQQEELEAAEL